MIGLILLATALIFLSKYSPLIVFRLERKDCEAEITKLRTRRRDFLNLIEWTMGRIKRKETQNEYSNINSREVGAGQINQFAKS